jgi:hypothetical protein
VSSQSVGGSGRGPSTSLRLTQDDKFAEVGWWQRMPKFERVRGQEHPRTQINTRTPKSTPELYGRIVQH